MFFSSGRGATPLQNFSKWKSQLKALQNSSENVWKIPFKYPQIYLYLKTKLIFDLPFGFAHLLAVLVEFTIFI